jgi:hypothetical protein
VNLLVANQGPRAVAAVAGLVVEVLRNPDLDLPAHTSKGKSFRVERALDDVQRGPVAQLSKLGLVREQAEPPRCALPSQSPDGKELTVREAERIVGVHVLEAATNDAWLHPARPIGLGCGLAPAPAKANATSLRLRPEA